VWESVEILAQEFEVLFFTSLSLTVTIKLASDTDKQFSLS
jgi:hypothetical protein